MTKLLQLTLKLWGFSLILMAIILSVENSRELLAKYSIVLKNSEIRSSFNIDIGDGSKETIAEKGEEPLYGLLDLKSFLFILFLLMGIFFLTVDFFKIVSLFKSILISPSTMEAKVHYLATRLKKMSESYYKKDMDSFVKEVNIKKVLPVWSFVITQIELRQPLNNIVMLLANEASARKKSLDHYVSIFSMLSNISPSLGVLGTVLGLVRLLQNMEDPSKLASGMSLALLTTFYGLFFSVIVFKTLVVRLRSLQEVEMRSYKIASFWLNFLDRKLAAFYMEPKYIDKSSKKFK